MSNKIILRILIVLIAALMGLAIFRLIHILPTINADFPTINTCWSLLISSIVGIIIGLLVWLSSNKIQMHRIVALIFILIGIFFIIYSSEVEFWKKLKELVNINALGVGLTLLAIAFAFLSAPSPTSSNQSNKKENMENKLEKNIDKLSKETFKIEKIVADCKKLTEDMRKLKEEADKETADS